MMQLVIYIHGKGGSIEEAKHYKSLFPNADVISFDYQSQTPWEAKKEFPVYYDMHSKGYDSVLLIANSIGAFFALSSLGNRSRSYHYAGRRALVSHRKTDALSGCMDQKIKMDKIGRGGLIG